MKSGKTNAAIDGSRNGSTGSVITAQFLAAANNGPVFCGADHSGIDYV